MYFDVSPKTKKEDLFGISYLTASLVQYINDYSIRVIIIRGLRRTGKTSLLNVSLNEIKQKHIKIDVRESPYYDRKEFIAYIIERIKAEIGETLFQKILKRVTGVKLSYKDIGTTFYFESEKNFITFFENLNKELKKKNQIIVIAFDEVQLLNKINFDYIIASIYDNYKNIKLILTGSEIGLINRFLGKEDAKAPLFGRALIEIETKRLTGEQISQFLIEGFNQINRKISLNETKEAIESFDGIIGWATHYGWLRSKNIPHNEAILKVIEEGSELVKRELNNFLVNRKKATYLKLLKWILLGYNKWMLLKNQFIRDRKKISDRQLNLYLKELIDYSFIEKINETYLITDPLLIRALTK